MKLIKKIKPFKTLEEEILLIQEGARDQPISVEKILHQLSGKGRTLILIFLSLPFCQPLQIPGLSTPFGLMIAFIGLRMAFGKQAWLPKNILSKKIATATIQKITTKTLVLLRKMKPWIHPRLNWVCHLPFMQTVHGLVICILGIILALPLPIPFSNLTAAWSIFLIALGILEDDGLLVLLGELIFLATLVFLALMVISIRHFF